MGEHNQRTHLYRFHSQNGRISLFAGFEMPMWYKGVVPEHMAVRKNVGIFDISHMGRTLVVGPEAEAFLDYVTTNDVAALVPLSAHYSLMCNERGGIIDDFVLSRIEEEQFLMVYNAINRDENLKWLIRHSRNFDASVKEASDSIAMFAVQGPKAEGTLQKVSTGDLGRIERFRCGWTELAGVDSSVSRTGYTGEDGFEVFVWNTSITNPHKAEKVWSAIMKAGQEVGIEPCGLGARDTLRLEAGMCLYGNDIDENTNPFEARLGFVVKTKKGKFIGRDALVEWKTEGLKRKRIGIRMLERGIPRQHCEVWRNEEKVGLVTSGTFSPLLKCGIAMAYVTKEHAVDGESVMVKIRNKLAKAEVVRFPLYDTTQYGFRRKT
ncbi:MAG: glycine cleavage system aminomethyltransferase GcvT [Candidatus Bathyarchaeota archaeon]|nr:MAG: glycine cleavage system aminomethyltransferase GcvT [Candidatus Bathyarchaeota archaeon]